VKIVATELVKEYRGGSVENIHYGHICGVNEYGQVVYSAGDPEWITYLRSAAKPVQAIPTFVHGFDDYFGLNDKEKTIMMASHRAQPYHVEALESMLQKLGLDEDILVCRPTFPLHMVARDALLLKGAPERKIYHNCSGKHLGLLSLCIGRGYPLQGYEDPNHPAQREILSVASILAEYPEEQIVIGIDGCGLPVFGMPLRNMAITFMKLACPDLIENADIRQAVEKITSLMNENYEMISSMDLICSNLLMDSNLVAKGGAKGIYCFGLRKERLAFALKVTDGSEEEWPLIIASILEQIDYDNKATINRMYNIAPREIKNDNGVIIGMNQTVFELKKKRILFNINNPSFLFCYLITKPCESVISCF
jgi:L-asparaginase II